MTTDVGCQKIDNDMNNSVMVAEQKLENQIRIKSETHVGVQFFTSIQVQARFVCLCQTFMISLVS
ncbi:CLUMA_CG001581, isoform A [Clunio marinus]|uniref:CLUMA_CG001581, isoform A n=1 Tax=Clunio marinus TaxID=568069 RepID=A0A1J1HI78_9DIPT|nr:CLUMA_CG001581, isoform A [Clunio marinus]